MRGMVRGERQHFPGTAHGFSGHSALCLHARTSAERLKSSESSELIIEAARPAAAFPLAAARLPCERSWPNAGRPHQLPPSQCTIIFRNK